ncbi:MAG: rhodanese-like domain-containing protein [Crocosphaera sp.]|nr:rhodanese-like domain-containing protein [Crocosphaera sp.]
MLIRIQFPSVTHISTEGLATWLEDKQQKSPLLLDARNPIEYAISHLRGAYLMPLNNKDILSCSLDTPIVTYCSVGYRSAILAQRLQKMGYKQVFNLEGSLFAWKQENRPIFCDEQIVSSIHHNNLFWALWLQ